MSERNIQTLMVAIILVAVGAMVTQWTVSFLDEEASKLEAALNGKKMESAK